MDSRLPWLSGFVWPSAWMMKWDVMLCIALTPNFCTWQLQKVCWRNTLIDPFSSCLAALDNVYRWHWFKEAPASCALSALLEEKEHLCQQLNNMLSAINPFHRVLGSVHWSWTKWKQRTWGVNSGVSFWRGLCLSSKMFHQFLGSVWHKGQVHSMLCAISDGCYLWQGMPAISSSPKHHDSPVHVLFCFSMH